MQEQNHKMSKRDKSIALLIFLIATIFSAVFLLSNIFGVKQPNDISGCVYLQSSKTTFNNDGTITVTLKNDTRLTFEDRIIHLKYEGPISGLSYSEQKVITFKPYEEVTITFLNPGWEYFQYNEIYAYEKDNNKDSTWIKLSNGRNFINTYNPPAELIVVVSSVICVLLIIDTYLVVSIAKHKECI